MNNETFYFFAFAVLVNLVVLHIIIGSATKASLRTKYEKAQTDLLSKIALKQGVSEDEIAKTFADAGLS